MNAATALFATTAPHTRFPVQDDASQSPFILSEDTRFIAGGRFVDQAPRRSRVVPLSELRDIRVATQQTRTHCVAVLALGFDHGVETFAVNLDEMPQVIGRLNAARS